MLGLYQWENLGIPGNSWGSCYFLPSSCRNDWVVDEVNRTWFLVQYNVQSEDLLT
jgi:hypothetical protein